jgi:hypothetical protein
LSIAKTAVTHATSREELDLVILRVRDILRWATPQVAALGSAFLKPLISNGYFPTGGIFSLLASRPAVVRRIARVLLVQVEARQPQPMAEKYIMTVLKVTGIEGKALEGILTLANPPASLMAQVAQIVKARPIPQEIVLPLMKCARRVVDLGYINLQDLVENAIAFARTADAKGLELTVEFFQNLADEDIEILDPKLWLYFFDAIARSGSGIMYRFVIAAVKKSRLFWGPAVALMALRETSGHLEEWCNTFEVLTHVMNDGFLQRLYDVLEELTSDEFTFGHITTPSGLKIVQRTPPQRYQPRLDGGIRCAFSASEEFHWDIGTAMQLRGWREIVLLLRVAPSTPKTLDLLARILEVHERPLAQAYADVLRRYGSTVVVVEWLETLFRGRQSRKVLALDILWALVNRSNSHFQYMAALLHRCMTEPTIPELVSAKAKRILRDVHALPLPPDVIELFDRSSASLKHFPQVREVRARASLPASISLPPMQPKRKLPLLDANAENGAGQAGAADARRVIVPVYAPTRRVLNRLLMPS